MKKTLLFLMFIFISLAYSQEKKRAFISFQTREDIAGDNILKAKNYTIPYYYILANNVRLRTKPTIKSNLVTELTIGTKFTIEKKDKQVFTISKVNANWYKIKTNKYEGWIFGAFIAKGAFGSSVDASIKFYYGIGLNGKTEIRAVQNGLEIDKTEIESNIGYISNLGGKAIAGVKDVIRAHIPCNGGCGCSTGNCIVFWNGVRFSKIYQLNAIADAWASEGDYFIYPSDIQGVANSIIWVSTTYLDNVKGEVKHKMIKTYYYWDGQNLQKDTSIKAEVSTYKHAG